MVISIYVFGFWGAPRALPLDPVGGLLSPVPRVLSPSETNFWLRPWTDIQTNKQTKPQTDTAETIGLIIPRYDTLREW